MFDEVVATNPIGEVEAESVAVGKPAIASEPVNLPLLENEEKATESPESHVTDERTTVATPAIPNIENEEKAIESPEEPVVLTGDNWLPMEEKTMEEKTAEPVAEEELTDEEKALANTEDDAEIAKRIRESDSFFSNFADNAREFARKERRLEIIQNMHGMKRASQLTPSAQTLHVETPTAQTSPDTQETESAELFQGVPLNKAELNASRLKSSQASNSNQTATDASFQQVVSGDDAWAFIQQNRTKMEEAKKAKDSEPSPAVKAFQEAWAKDVYRQFQKAGLYQGIDYLYFYKVDFPKGLKTLKERAITVEDQKEAYLLNEVIQAYLAKAKSEKDDVKRNAMAFYKMCEEREYNTLNVITY